MPSAEPVHVISFPSNGNDGGAALRALLQQVEGSPQERVRLLWTLLGEPACRQLGIYPIPEGFKLSVVIPVYNEERWIRELVRRVQAVEIPKELVIVDDCSKDGMRAILEELQGDNVRVFFQERNQGKGAALRRGFQE